MPTLPPEREPRSPLESHQVRAVAESFGTNPERYDRTRPRYPDAMVDRVIAAGPGPGPCREVVDVGCGTGIVARQFQAAGCRVTGVEPDGRMAEWTRRGGLVVEEATFEEWDPAGRTFDAVVSGQAWHWVDPVAGAVKAARILRPEGRLAVFWNVSQPPPRLSEALAEIYRRLLPEAPGPRRPATAADGHAALSVKAADAIRAAGTFGEPEQWSWDWDQHYTREEWLDQLPTTGGFTRLPQAQLEEVLDGIGAVVDAMGGGFTMRYTTVAVTARRTGASRTS
jgi:SAM-dependent methyltransferase